MGVWRARNEGAGGDTVKELREILVDGDPGGHLGAGEDEDFDGGGIDEDGAFTGGFGGLTLIGALAGEFFRGKLAVGGAGHGSEYSRDGVKIIWGKNNS